MKQLFLSLTITFFSFSLFATELELALSTTSLKDLTISCTRTDDVPSTQGFSLRKDFEELIESCRQNGLLEASSIIPGKSFQRSLKSEIDSLMIETFGEMPFEAQGLRLPLIGQVKLNIDEGKFYLYSLVKYGLQLRFRVWGNIEHIPADNELKIRLNKAKLGYIPVTKALFYTLSRFKIKGLRVSRPFIWIEMKNLIF